MSTLAPASNLVFHIKTRHIEVDYHFVRERVLRHDLLAKLVASHDQLADILTEGLPHPRFLWLASKLIRRFPMRLKGDEKQEEEEHDDTQQLQMVSSASLCSKTKVKGKTPATLCCQLYFCPSLTACYIRVMARL